MMAIVGNLYVHGMIMNVLILLFRINYVINIIHKDKMKYHHQLLHHYIHHCQMVRLYFQKFYQDNFFSLASCQIVDKDDHIKLNSEVNQVKSRQRMFRFI